MSLAQAANDPDPAAQVAGVRSFNRFWTRTIGALNKGLLDSPYSLTEVRVIFELAHKDGLSSSDVRAGLGLDSGYLSRILARLTADGIVTSAPSDSDGRRRFLALTRHGRSVFRTLNERADQEIRTLLAPLAESDRRRLLGAMAAIRRIVGPEEGGDVVVLRAPRAGDLGWVLERHGSLYSFEYGFDEAFEALVAKVLAEFASNHDPRKEAGWIAERDGGRVGSIFCMRKTARTAQLRLLLVDPGARGMGIGSLLVKECVDFARRAGYRDVILWTKDVLHDARRIYERAGFELVEQEEERDAAGARGQYWRLVL